MTASKNSVGDNVRQFALFLLTPFLALFGVLIILGDRLFLSWWLGKRIARQEESEFAKEIEQALPFLFVDHSAQIIRPDRQYPPSFDYAVVLVAVEGLRFRFVRGRGDFRVDVTTEQRPSNWEEVGSVLTEIGTVEGSRARQQYFRLQDFGRLLEPNLIRMRDELSSRSI